MSSLSRFNLLLSCGIFVNERRSGKGQRLEILVAHQTVPIQGNLSTLNCTFVLIRPQNLLPASISPPAHHSKDQFLTFLGCYLPIEMYVHCQSGGDTWKHRVSTTLAPQILFHANILGSRVGSLRPDIDQLFPGLQSHRYRNRCPGNCFPIRWLVRAPIRRLAISLSQLIRN